jgi:5-methylcytosine-specific restriction protein A
MPTRPKRHQPAAPATPQHKTPEQERGTSSQRGYNYRWQQSRKGFLAKHPLCKHCQQQGRVTAATDVDHIVPHRGDMALFWDRTNWQGLCHPCHSAKTATEDGGFGNVRRA